MKRSEVQREQEIVRGMLADAGIAVGPNEEVEIADFGLGRYRKEGLGLVVRVNEPEYCSKWLTLLPGQCCPWHFHKRKKETFFVLKGEVHLDAGADHVVLHPGDRHTISQGVEHQFSTPAGAVIEEVSTYDENADSYFRNPNVVRDPVIEED
ncbi:MAG TPA: cupin domain-containing protein [Capsulimonadaceae bacterium]|nr:cupin domain-containing protein [Capsulimonadaceae bacterium]